jgi:hypothetical protein
MPPFDINGFALKALLDGVRFVSDNLHIIELAGVQSCIFKNTHPIFLDRGSISQLQTN